MYMCEALKFRYFEKETSIQSERYSSVFCFLSTQFKQSDEIFDNFCRELILRSAGLS